MTHPFDTEVARAHRVHSDLLDAFLERQAAELKRLAEICAECLGAGGKLLLFGNGGSAAQAQHLAAEFVNRYVGPRRALAALALTADGPVLTSVGNDTEFRLVFSRQIEAFGRPDDVALGLSTSGESPNVVVAMQTARRLGLRTAALLGGDGGAVREAVDLALVVPGHETARVQEVQIFAGHVLCQQVEHLLEPECGDER